MQFKTLFLTLSGILSIGILHAQDKLHKKNGQVLEVKVIEVSPREISYKRFNNTDGPTYKIAKQDVAKVVYENGSEDNFAPVDRDVPKKNIDYGNNIISFAPVQITSGIGLGLSYERALDKANILSFYFLGTVAFNDNNVNDPVTGTPVTGNGTVQNNFPTYYIMPGIKFYPTGGKGMVRYGVGPSLVYVTGKRWVNDIILDNNGNAVAVDTGFRDRSALGIMVNNSLNINPTKHLHMGLELGLGFTYVNKIGTRNVDPTALAQFGFKIGYRF